jgi:hypothetical protein
MLRESTNFRSITLVLIAATLLGACAESERPQATGKAFFRGMNAISSAPAVTFLIEERGLEVVPFKRSSAAQQFDDFTYKMNFDYAPAQGADDIRLATAIIDTVVDQDYLVVLAGQFSSPQTFVWERVNRIWDGTETVTQIDFGHAATTIGEVDVYFDVPGTAPVLGNAVGSLQFGQVLAPMDFAIGDYEIIVTAKDDPATTIYQSDSVNYPATQTLTAVLLDADPSITAPAALRLVNATGATAELPDVNFLPTVRFLHASLNEVPVDISINGDTANPIATNVLFADINADIEVPNGSVDYTYTEAGNTGVILLEQTIINFAGTRGTHLLHGAAGATRVATQIDDRRPRATNARYRFANMSLNATGVDIYLVEPGSDIADPEINPELFNLIYPLSSVHNDIVAGSYDLWITIAAVINADLENPVALAGPIPMDFVNGDNVEMAILDNVDPAIVDILEYQR